jgi:hypothetical protein
MTLGRVLSGLVFTLLMVAATLPAGAQTAPVASGDTLTGDSVLRVNWEVRNRFRLFREEKDFVQQVHALQGRSIVESEQFLAQLSDGRGWARNVLGRLCIDQAGRVAQPCMREGARENYITPEDHPVTVTIEGPLPAGSTCAWIFDDGDGPRQSNAACNEPVNLRARYGKPTIATVDVSAENLAPQRLTTEILVTDLFIAGLGDSIAAGEGNPDRPVNLSSDGFCFRSFLSDTGGQYFRPSRAGYRGSRACDGSTDPANLVAWQRQGAQWFNAACHRSLYSYQSRAALALAAANPHIAVTFLPLACTGATIDAGLLGNQRARECLITANSVSCPGTINAQIAELREAVTAAQRRQPQRRLDLVFLTVGANDIDFSGLVADVIVDGGTERALLRRAGVLGSVDDARATLNRELPRGFAQLREALRPLVGGELSRVLYVTYGNPALMDGAPCPGGRDGLDIHPAFRADAGRMSNVVNFVQNEFLPAVRALALCEGGVLCRNPGADRMSFANTHQPAFAAHGVCVRADTDPPFDRDCFAADGNSFEPGLTAAAAAPLVCNRPASEFRAYAPRARWVRSANDSYFAAMTYPQGLSASMQPADIHDATWGLLSAVYGGAIHPSAEGHAAMADAAVPVASAILRLPPRLAEITYEPLPPPVPVPQQ